MDTIFTKILVYKYSNNVNNSQKTYVYFIDLHQTYNNEHLHFFLGNGKNSTHKNYTQSLS
jgi:hypothetical protein